MKTRYRALALLLVLRFLLAGCGSGQTSGPAQTTGTPALSEELENELAACPTKSSTRI